MKKDKLNLLGLAAFVLILALVLASCGGNPKDLAKQTYNLVQEAMTNFADANKMAEIEKKMTALEKKVEKLSPKDQQIYEEEVTQLVGSVWGNFFGF